MNTPMYQTVSVSCPNCGTQFVTPVVSIVDAVQNPEAKALLLSGRLNIALCSQCGHAGMLSAPLVYHDSEAELLLTYLPAELDLSELERQQLLGELTNQVLSSLPSDQRKGYLLQPRSFLRLEGLLEAILEADGITPEMLAEQRAKASLLDRLLHTTNDEARKAIVLENEAQIDYEFFQLLSLNLELAQSAGQEQATQQLLGLRGQLLEWTEAGREVAAREEAIRELGTEISREELLDKLVDAALAGEQAKVETMVAVARPAIDYLFYQQLTARIEAQEQAGESQTAETLRALRETILDLTAQIDAEIQRATEQAGQLLQQILESEDLEQALRSSLDLVDDLFLGVLSTSLAAAEDAGRAEDAQRLRQVGETLMKLLEESQPPKIRLINQLLNTEYPDSTQALLQENRHQIDPELLELMRLVGEDFAESGREELAQRLSLIRAQAETMTE